MTHGIGRGLVVTVAKRVRVFFLNGGEGRGERSDCAVYYRDCGLGWVLSVNEPLGSAPPQVGALQLLCGYAPCRAINRIFSGGTAVDGGKTGRPYFVASVGVVFVKTFVRIQPGQDDLTVGPKYSLRDVDATLDVVHDVCRSVV